ncbi:hypothetical protein [Dyadobacter sp. OTU695]|uniref:hypothetical protein n=1 Tax=Dyadobacter sp. OTU695 TaxID=3043860 RepID=UPI00313CD2E0
MDGRILEEDYALVWSKEGAGYRGRDRGFVPENQYEVYLRMKGLEEKYPPVKIDDSIDLSRLADDSNNAAI